MANLTVMTPLEKQFHQDCLDGVETLKKHKYNPTYFLQMVHEHGGVEAARRLLKAPNFQEGLHTLYSLRLLRMSVEAAVLQPRWASLFTDVEKTEARKRLTKLNYDPQTDAYDVSTSKTGRRQRTNG